MAEIHLQHINHHRGTQTSVIILIVCIVLIEVDLTIVIIPVNARNIAVIDRTYPFNSCNRNHNCLHWFAFFTSIDEGDSAQT